MSKISFFLEKLIYFTSNYPVIKTPRASAKRIAARMVSTLEHHSAEHPKRKVPQLSLIKLV